jgi:hypothetical protein
MTNSRRKGKRGELEAAQALTCLGINARRAVQYCGRGGTADLATDRPIHVEVKRQERLNPYEAVEQAANDSDGKVPAVLWRRNRRNWLLILRLDDIPRFIEALKEA